MATGTPSVRLHLLHIAMDARTHSGYLLDGVQQRREQVRVVVRSLSLQDAHQSLQSHPSVHTELGQQLQTPVHLPDSTHTHTHTGTSTSSTLDSLVQVRARTCCTA